MIHDETWRAVQRPLPCPLVMTQVILEVPEAALQLIGKEPAGFAREVYETAVVKWYDERLISSGKGADLLGISRAAFLELLYRHKVSPFQYTPEELAAEVKDG
jgi:predicted HTH domain antitoxin